MCLSKISMLNSLQVTAIMVKLNGLETVIGAVCQSPYKPLVEEDFNKLIKLSMSKIFIFWGNHVEWKKAIQA